MPAGWKPITVQKIIQIQSNLEYCVLTACDWRRWDGEAIFSFLFKKIPISIFNARHTGGECKHFPVSDWKKKAEKKNLLMAFRQRQMGRGGGVNFPQCKLLTRRGVTFGLPRQPTLN